MPVIKKKFRSYATLFTAALLLPLLLRRSLASFTAQEFESLLVRSIVPTTLIYELIYIDLSMVVVVRKNCITSIMSLRLCFQFKFN